MRTPPAWLVGMAIFPFGLVVGFTITALPFLLTNLNISLDKVAAISATVMSPTFWGFLLQPLMDTGLTRRAYSWLTATVAAICLSAALFLLSRAHLGASTVLLLLAELSMVLFSGAVSGWTSEFTPDRLRGSVSGWTNVANLGGGALGSLAIMSLSPHVALHWLGIGLGMLIVLGTAPTLLFPAPKKSAFHFRQIFTDALRSTWRASKTKQCLTGFALFSRPQARRPRSTCSPAWAKIFIPAKARWFGDRGRMGHQRLSGSVDRRIDRESSITRISISVVRHGRRALRFCVGLLSSLPPPSFLEF